MLFKDISIVNNNFEIEHAKDVLVEADRIISITEGSQNQDIKNNYKGRVFDGKDSILIPGFFNSHAHSPMTLMRGYGENMSLQDWLFKKIFPFEEHLTYDSVYWGTLLAMAESMKFGIVSTSDMYFLSEAMIEAVIDSKMKDNISRAIANVSGEKFHQLDSVKEMKYIAKKYNHSNNNKIIIDSALHAEYTSDEKTVRALAELTKDLGLRMHLHLSETKLEHEECMMRHSGRTPAEYLNDCGIFDVKTTAAHCVYVTEHDRDILKEKGVTVATNPVSNMKLAGGICDVLSLMKKDINIAIGTDGVASNNNLSFFEEMKTLSLLAKVSNMDPTVLSPKEALYMATRGGAISQGRMDSGQIEVGNKADLVVIRKNTPNMTPDYNLLNNLVLSATDTDIEMTMVDGEVLFEKGEYKHLDIERIIFHVKDETSKILKKL